MAKGTAGRDFRRDGAKPAEDEVGRRERQTETLKRRRIKRRPGGRNMEENRGGGGTKQRETARERERERERVSSGQREREREVDTRYRKQRGGRTQFERVASVGGFNEVSCNYMH